MAIDSDGSLYCGGLNPGTKPSLARLEDVSQLVNEFAGGIFALKASFHEGRPEARDPLAVIEAEAARCGDIILGRDESFDAQPWNRPERLGVTLRCLLPEETRHYGDPGKALFMFLANQMLNASKSLDGCMLEDDVRREVKKICDDVTRRILGTGAE